ncbi:MAG: hypothetical protein JXA89_14595 [Anaerolineae bacterium]|nr:hypothetical protein [Anaerolineae bacterium]
MTRKQIAILWGLAAIVLIVFVLVGRAISRSAEKRPSPVAISGGRTYNLEQSSHSARNLYARADQAARSWQKDARLVSASASWRFVKVDDFSAPTNWTFQFFSPRTQKLYVVSASETQVTVIRDTLSPYVLPAAPIGEWQLDSNQALSIWLNNGGGDFLDQHPVADVSAMLQPPEAGGLEWLVIGTVPDSQSVYLVRIDAGSGALLQ